MESKDKDKYAKWFFTWEEDNEEILINSINLTLLLKQFTIEYQFQQEKATRIHWQGYFKWPYRTRKSTILKKFAEHGTYLFTTKHLTLLPARGTDEQLRAYVSKTETRIGETFYSAGLEPYKGVDIALLDSQDRWYLWQSTLHALIFDEFNNIKRADDRTILFIVDQRGNSGKSKYLKYLAIKYPDSIMKVPFGTASQLRSSICTATPRKIYFFDITRTLAEEDSMNTLYSLVEDIKNGYVTTSMYGQYKQLIFDPPHIVIFSNTPPKEGKLSPDRWKIMKINEVNKQLENI